MKIYLQTHLYTERRVHMHIEEEGENEPSQWGYEKNQVGPSSHCICLFLIHTS